MTTAHAFLEAALKPIENDIDKSRKHYLFSLSQGIDSSFILDLNRIKVFELSQATTLRETLAFLRFIMTSPEEKDINDVLQNYLRLEKGKEFAKSTLWNLLYSLESARGRVEEFFIVTNILSSSRTPKAMVSFFIFCRQVICATANADDSKTLDEISLSFAQLNLVMGQIFGDKVSSKIFLIRDFSKGTKSSSFVSKMLQDWIANHRQLHPHRKEQSASPLRAAPKPALRPPLDRSPTKKVLKMHPSASATRTFSPGVTQTTSLSVKSTKSESRLHSRADSNGLMKEMVYLMHNQDETKDKIEKIRTVNSDLIREYNTLLDKGKAIYNAYFDLYYSLKLEMKNKYSKFPLNEDEIESVKKFQGFKRLELGPLAKPKENPMQKLL